jgi:hypothetical protein
MASGRRIPFRFFLLTEQLPHLGKTPKLIHREQSMQSQAELFQSRRTAAFMLKDAKNILYNRTFAAQSFYGMNNRRA